MEAAENNGENLREKGDFVERKCNLGSKKGDF